jgi:chromate transporter
MWRDVWEVSRLFLKLGTTAFGGPAAHIALMRREAVERRKWLTEQAFLDLLGATNLIPGPNSTEMAIHIGYLRAGWPGLIAAGVCFIVPAMLLVTGMASMYLRSGAVPQIGWVLYGIKPVVLALIVHAVWGLAKSVLSDARRKIAFVAVLALYFAGVNEIALLFGTGLLGLGAGWMRPWRKDPDGQNPDGQNPDGQNPDGQNPGGQGPGEQGAGGAVRAGREGSGGGAVRALIPAMAVGAGSGAAAAGVAAMPFTLTLLFFKFLKIGSVLYGSGYVLLPFLKSEFVERAGWLSESQVMDAVSVGQFTPGPFFTTATFIGHILGGVPGGLLATLGIFLPAFVFVAVSNPWIPRLRDSAALGRLLDGVNAASLALMAGAAWQTGRASVMDATTGALAAAALGLLFRKNVSGTVLIVVGGTVGVIVRAAASS